MKPQPWSKKESNQSRSLRGKESKRYQCRAIAFGHNYYHALGGTESIELAQRPHRSFPNNDESPKAPLQEDKILAHHWREPPWKSKERDDREVAEVACTVQSTMFLTAHGKVYQTGTLHGQIQTEPLPVTIPLPLKCVQISAGRHFCLARMEGGRAVVSWGAGHFGQLGIGPLEGDAHVTFVAQPVVIERLLPNIIGSTVEKISAGDWHALALTKSGRVWAWGSNRSQQCGRKPSSTRANSNQTPTITVPLPVPLDVPASQISAGRSHSVAIAAESGQIYCWGSSNHGQCGKVVRRSGVSPPRLIEGLSDLCFGDVSAGGNHTLAVTTGGRVFSWGSGLEGELGLGVPTSAQSKPRIVGDLDFVAIEAGQEWKNLQKSSLCHNSGDSATMTTQVAEHLASTPRITKVFSGPSYSMALSSTGHVYAWGSNDAGQLGAQRPTTLPWRDNGESGTTATSTVRDLDVQTFDSRHNVLLPKRIDSLNRIRVRTIGCGPNHLWCVGEDREDDHNPAVGRTLYEVQEDGRYQKLSTMQGRQSPPSAGALDSSGMDADHTEATVHSTNDELSPVVSGEQTLSWPTDSYSTGAGSPGSTVNQLLTTLDRENGVVSPHSRALDPPASFAAEIRPSRRVPQGSDTPPLDDQASAPMAFDGSASTGTPPAKKRSVRRRFSLSKLLRRRFSSGKNGSTEDR